MWGDMGRYVIFCSPTRKAAVRLRGCCHVRDAHDMSETCPAGPHLPQARLGHVQDTSTYHDMSETCPAGGAAAQLLRSLRGLASRGGVCEATARYGEIWGDMGRYGEIWGRVVWGQCIEMVGNVYNLQICLYLKARRSLPRPRRAHWRSPLWQRASAAAPAAPQHPPPQQNYKISWS